MSRNYFSDIIRKFTERRFSRKTEEKIQQWIIDEEYSNEKNEEMHNFWKSLNLESDNSVHTALEKVNEKLNIGKQRQKSIWMFIPRIAAVLIPLVFIIGFTIYFVKSDNKMLTVYAPYGANKQLTLPDQSVVWLNSGSTLQYPKEFEGNSRSVHLSGEAYFSVARDTSKQFIVETKQMTVKVLGTVFNVNAYPEDSLIITSVDKGKVQIIVQNNSCYLGASEQIIYNKFTSECRVNSLNSEDHADWRNGELVFEGKTLPEILLTLERTYNVCFEIDHQLLAENKTFTIKFVDHENIKQIMDVMGAMIGFSYKEQSGCIKLSRL